MNCNMPRIRIYDVPGGDGMTLDLVDETTGYLQPTFFRSEDERFADFFNIKHLKCRDDDIFLNSYPKTGTHWVWEIVTLLLNHTSTVTGESKIKAMIESCPTSRMADLPSPRVLNTHLRIRYLPQEAWEKKLKTIFVCRNPKDVVVSLYYHTRGIHGYQYEGKFGNFLAAFMRGEIEYGSYAEYLLDWQSHIRDNPDLPVLIVYYEDLKQNLLGELKRIRQFLGVDIADSLLQDMALNLVFNNMKVGKESAMTEQDKDFLKMFSRPGFTFLRKGLIGDWMNMFTVAQSEAFDAWWAKVTKDLEIFRFRYL